ncbi:hypothetical protein MIR68_001552 [Amoeboaphelidium protococcarum]|nr:hypothetical protein MIR68_001552 [Amoeboaphelidium protococcarum]
MCALTLEQDAVMRQWLNKNVDRGSYVRVSRLKVLHASLSVSKANCTNDSKLRLCMYYRGLNKITIKNRNPLPNISELFRSLQKGQLFTALDLDGALNYYVSKLAMKPKLLSSPSMVSMNFWQCHQSQYTIGHVMNMNRILQLDPIVLDCKDDCVSLCALER